MSSRPKNPQKGASAVGLSRLRFSGTQGSWFLNAILVGSIDAHCRQLQRAPGEDLRRLGGGLPMQLLSRRGVALESDLPKGQAKLSFSSKVCVSGRRTDSQFFSTNQENNPVYLQTKPCLETMGICQSVLEASAQGPV